MATDIETTGSSKGMIWTGRVMSGVVVLMLLFSAVMKLSNHSEVAKEFTRLGWSETKDLALGILEIVCTIVYAIPQTAVLGAILLTGYLGGATATHVRIDDPFFGPVIGGMLVWLGLFLRDGRLRALIPLRR
ncbi:MAG: DoxX family protein [Bythopirellula sp.]|nr:DoxX family protein [Bythopirellula sp.]